jgi:hypothetical protein
MKSIKNICCILIGAVAFLASCSKNYGYQFENGTGSVGYNDSTGLEVDTAMDRVDASKFTAAQIYPGMVTPVQPRIKDTLLQIDLNYRTATASDLRVSVLPSNWISTGLWAPAGELIKIVIPDGIYGLTVQVGSHTDNLTGKDVLQRDPVIVVRRTLYPGVNYVRNLYGGLVYILPQRPLGQVLPVIFSGVCAGANFVLGKTTDEEWRQMISKTSVPFFEIIGKRIAFTLPKANLSLVSIPSPTALMQKWDSLIKAVYYDWYGLSDNNPDIKNRSPYLPWRIVFDIQPSVGAMHSGDPIVAGQTSGYFYQAVTIGQLEQSNWGVFHEIGHNMQMHSTWTFSNNGEVTCNLFSLKKSSIYNYIPGPLNDGWYGTGGQTPGAASFLALDSSAKDWSVLTNLGQFYPRMAIYAQIFEKYGYGFMTYLATAARNARFTSIDNQSKIDFFYERLSEYTQTDMYRFMREWGLKVSQTSRNAIAAKGYRKLMTNVWMYNPITNTGGDQILRSEHARTSWLLTLPSAHASYPGTNLIDNNATTFWNSNYSGTGIASVGNITYQSTNTAVGAVYPQSLTVKTGAAPITASGFYLQQRNNSANSNSHIKDLTIAISDDGTNWETLGTFPLLYGNTNVATWAKQYIEIPGGDKTFQYFRYTWSKPVNDNYTALAEIGTWIY